MDAAKISSLSFRQEVGGDNFEFLIKLSYNPEAERVLGPYPKNTSPPAGRAVSVISVPVTLYENGRFSYAKLEVQVWRA